MTKIKFGNQHDESSANYDIATNKTRIQIGNQYGRSTRNVIVRNPDPDGPKSQRLNTVLAFSFGLTLIGTILALIVEIPNPTRPQLQFFSIVLALASGGFATTISGIFNVQMSIRKKTVIGATGAFAVFVIVYFFIPAMAK